MSLVTRNPRETPHGFAHLFGYRQARGAAILTHVQTRAGSSNPSRLPTPRNPTPGAPAGMPILDPPGPRTAPQPSPVGRHTRGTVPSPSQSLSEPPMGDTPVPAKPRRPCPQPGCSELVTDGYCPDHATDYARGSSASRGYGWAWSKRRADFLARNPWCVDCGAPATDADHAPVSRRALVARGVPDPDNDAYLQPRCHACHSRRTVTRDGGWGRLPTQ